MSAHMKKHPIRAHSHGSMLYITDHAKTYAIPKKIANQFILETSKHSVPTRKIQSSKMSTTESLFAKLDQKYTRAGALLKGLRLREDLSQVEFAKKINVTQANLSNMENGRRSIGKTIAKRIQKHFKVNYRYFLE